MATADSTPHDYSAIPPWPVRRFSVQDYRKLGELGVLTPEDRVELLEGWIVPKMNQKPAHGYCVGLMNERIQQQLPEGYIVRCQLPISTSDSEPEPDISIVKGGHPDFRHRHPSGKDCALIVEVADTSVDRDRRKAAIYAAAGVEVYWILNLVDNQLETHARPGPTRYQSTNVVQRDATAEIRLGDAVLPMQLSELFD